MAIPHRGGRGGGRRGREFSRTRCRKTFSFLERLCYNEEKRKGVRALEDLKAVVAQNLVRLRTQAGMTQLELAERLHYSDKSVSKWERGEALPDVAVLKKLGEIFGVSVSTLIGEDAPKPQAPARKADRRVLTGIVLLGVWTLALLVFIILWLCGRVCWLVFAYMAPVCLVTWLVLNSVWRGGKHNFLIIGGFLASVVAAVYFSFLRYNWWQLFLLLIPSELIVFFSYCLKKSKRPQNPET